VSACLRFLQAEGVRAWAAVRPHDLRRFLTNEAGRRPFPSSQARTIAALKGFFRFLVESEAIELNPATDAEMMFDTRRVRREKPIRAICAATFPDPTHRSQS
jgi:site-specific recombinase XerD